MARPVRGCPMPWSKQGYEEEPESNPSIPQQRRQPDTTEGEVTVDYDLDVDYEGSEPKKEPIVQEEKKKTLTQNM